MCRCKSIDFKGMGRLLDCAWISICVITGEEMSSRGGTLPLAGPFGAEVTPLLRLIAHA